MSLTLVTAPPVDPLTLAETKAYLRVDYSDDDDLIGALITAARTMLDGKDGILGRALVQQTWDYTLDGFPRAARGNPYAAIFVPLSPLQSITSITYTDTSGNIQTLAASKYTVDKASEPGRIVPAYGETWPSTRADIGVVTVRFVAGYKPDNSSSPVDYRANIPRAIRTAMLLLVAHWYEKRQVVEVGRTASELPLGVDALLAPYQVFQ